MNLDDLRSALGWRKGTLRGWLSDSVFGRPARRFARLMAEFDEAVGQRGLVDAARHAQNNYIDELRIVGSENIPSGPFLAVANHPGMTDTLSLFRALGRDDLKILALRRPFLQALPHVEQHLLYLDRGAAAGRSLVREVREHLKGGGAVLTFPAGRIEPDPDVQRGALESLQSWADSVGIFVRGAPEAAILPMLVRGVVWSRVMNHPLMQLRRDPGARGGLAAAIQLLLNMTRGPSPLEARVQIGRAMFGGALGQMDKRTVHETVLAAMRQLIENPP